MNVNTRFRTPLAGALLGGLLLGHGVAHAAGAVEPEARPIMTIAGTWMQMVTFRDCATGEAIRPPFPALNTYFRDHSHIEIGAGLSPALRSGSQGRWRRVGARTFVNHFEFFIYDSAGNYINRQVYDRHLELSADGRTLTATSRSTRYTPDGVVVFTGCATEEGERIPNPQVP